MWCEYINYYFSIFNHQYLKLWFFLFGVLVLWRFRVKFEELGFWGALINMSTLRKSDFKESSFLAVVVLWLFLLSNMLLMVMFNVYVC